MRTGTIDWCFFWPNDSFLFVARLYSCHFIVLLLFTTLALFITK